MNWNPIFAWKRLQNYKKFETLKSGLVTAGTMASISGQRKKELIKIKLAGILTKASSNPKFEGVTVVDVKLSPDSSSAVVFYSVFGPNRDTQAITEALNAASGFFQSKLGQTLHSRNTPRLSFVFDKGFDHASRIDQLLSQVKK
jgi:ribosome-binding factor A